MLFKLIICFIAGIGAGLGTERRGSHQPHAHHLSGGPGL